MSFSIENNNQYNNNNFQTTPQNRLEDSSFQEALENFYELHQRSQISGVPTHTYQGALRDLGIDTQSSQAAFHGIKLLEDNGYGTGKPSDEAILKYGAINQEHGNKSYMKNGVDSTSEALKEEIALLNEESEDAFVGARNYYEVAAKRVSSSPLELSAKNILPQQPLISTEESLKLELKNEILSLLKSDKNLLRDLLKELF